jgi:putative transposase
MERAAPSSAGALCDLENDRNYFRWFYKVSKTKRGQTTFIAPNLRFARYRRPWSRHAPPLPITVAEVPVHIIQRGNNRGACFFADADDELYLAQLKALAAKSEGAVHATCLMTNHVHLLLTPQRVCGCTRLIKHLEQRHVQHVNRSWRRSGTLWEGRLRPCLAQSERDVLACYPTIELNPRRAGMASHPRPYRWSSYRINA